MCKRHISSDKETPRLSWKGYLVQIHLFLQLDQLSGGIVAVGGDFAVPAGFLDQVVGRAVIETVGFAVFVGEDGQTAGFVVGVGEGMAQCVGAFERQSVHCEFVGGFGAESVDMGGQSVEAVVFEGFVTAVGIVGTDGVACCVGRSIECRSKVPRRLRAISLRQRFGRTGNAQGRAL